MSIFLSQYQVVAIFDKLLLKFNKENEKPILFICKFEYMRQQIRKHVSKKTGDVRYYEYDYGYLRADAKLVEEYEKLLHKLGLDRKQRIEIIIKNDIMLLKGQGKLKYETLQDKGFKVYPSDKQFDLNNFIVLKNANYEIFKNI